MFGKIFNRFTSIQIKTGVLILIDKIFKCFIILLLAKYDLVSVDIDQIRLFTIWEIKTVTFIIEPHRMTFFCPIFIYIDGHGNAKYFPGILYLVYNNQGCFFCVVVTVIDVENRVAAAKIPLIPIPVQI